MADSYVETVAGELADMALADQAASDDIAIVDAIGEILGASSQTLQEAYMTAVRVRRAEARARELLAYRKANNYAAGPVPKAAPLQGVVEDTSQTASETAAEAAPKSAAPQAPPQQPSPKGTPTAGAPRRVTR